VRPRRRLCVAPRLAVRDLRNATVLAGLLTALLLSGCATASRQPSSSTATPATSSAPTGASSRTTVPASIAPAHGRRRLKLFASCLSAHGFRLSPKGAKAAPSAYRHALSTCLATLRRAPSASTTTATGAAANASSTPSAKHPAPPHAPARVMSILHTLTACMRRHGVPGFPEPQGASFPIPRTVNTTTPAYRAAETACGPILQALDTAR
jgi:hypothetical protein